MPKFSRTPRHTQLSRTVRKTVETHHKSPRLLSFVVPVVSDQLLSKLKLSPEQLQKARMIEAHHFRISSHGPPDVDNYCALSVRSSRKIVEHALADLPGFIKRNKAQLSPLEMEFIQSFEEILRRNKPILRQKPALEEVEQPLELLSFAKRINQDKLKMVLGETKWARYQKAFNRALRGLPHMKRESWVDQFIQELGRPWED